MSEALDMRDTIIPKSDQLNADDLIAGPLTIRIRKVSRAGDVKQPIAINFDGDDNKPYMPCKSMRRIMVLAWGEDGREYVGRSMTLYRDPGVIYGGAEVGGIRVSHMSHIDKPLVVALTISKSVRRPFRVLPLTVTASTTPPPTTTATPDREAAIQAGTTSLIQAIDDAPDDAALDALLADPKTIERIDWRRANRPDQAQDIDAAVMGARSRLASVLPGDGWPGPTTDNPAG
jgi:hypothetical protein